MAFIQIDGKMIAAGDAGFPAGNWSLRFGQGLFETMLVKNGVLLLADYHMDRLRRGMELLGWHLPVHMSFAQLPDKILETAAKNKMSAMARVRLQVYTDRKGLWELQMPEHAGYIIECFEVAPGAADWNDNGLVTGLADGIVKSCDRLANLKSTSMFSYAAAARQAKTAGWNDALLPNIHGRIAESTIANVFVVMDGKIYTPPPDEGCVAGVMRQYLLDHAPEIGQRPIALDDIRNADEVFLTNAVRGIKWVGTFEDRKYGCQIGRKLWEQIVQPRK
jgi:branched-chain amino acid aminotransferase